MPLVPDRPPVPSFEEFVEDTLNQEKGLKIANHLNEAEARLNAGLDPMPPYTEGNIGKIINDRLQQNHSNEQTDTKEEV